MLCSWNISQYFDRKPRMFLYFPAEWIGFHISHSTNSEGFASLFFSIKLWASGSGHLCGRWEAACRGGLAYISRLPSLYKFLRKTQDHQFSGLFGHESISQETIPHWMEILHLNPLTYRYTLSIVSLKAAPAGASAAIRSFPIDDTPKLKIDASQRQFLELTVVSINKIWPSIH